MSTTTETLSATATDCPSWCNEHRVMEDNVDGGVTSWHRHSVPLVGSTLEVEDTDDVGLIVTLPEMYHYTLPEARELAAAIVAACDAVEAAPPATP